MAKPRVKVREQPVEERIHNFNEVPLHYSKEEALQEASRCLQCDLESYHEAAKLERIEEH